MKTISADELKQKLDNRDNAIVINVLSQENYEEKHIPGTINIPQNKDNFTEQVQKEIPEQDKEIIVYCASKDCDASTKAAEKLEKAGYTQVVDFEEGTKGWEEKGYAVISQ